jgi:hypothetical protein
MNFDLKCDGSKFIINLLQINCTDPTKVSGAIRRINETKYVVKSQNGNVDYDVCSTSGMLQESSN